MLRGGLPHPLIRPWLPRQARWLLVKPDEELQPDQRTYLAQFVERCPQVRVAQHLTREFLRLVRERDHAAFALWLVAAGACGLPEMVEFAKGLIRDRAAVEAALQYRWSNGPDTSPGAARESHAAADARTWELCAGATAHRQHWLSESDAVKNLHQASGRAAFW